jgi:hypothetical protein
VIALARVVGSIDLFFLGGSRLLDLGGSLFFEPDTIPDRLFLSFFFAVLRRTILQVGFRDPPSRSCGPTIVTAVPIQGMIGREIPIAPLEQTLSGRKATGFALPGARRRRIL